jgi:hypothetical protein
MNFVHCKPCANKVHAYYTHMTFMMRTLEGVTYRKNISFVVWQNYKTIGKLLGCLLTVVCNEKEGGPERAQTFAIGLGQ